MIDGLNRSRRSSLCHFVVSRLKKFREKNVERRRPAAPNCAKFYKESLKSSSPLQQFDTKFLPNSPLPWDSLPAATEEDGCASIQPTVLTTVLQKFGKNATRVPIAWCFKLANSVTSCDKIESGSLRPSEIWQPWYPNFGNPENQIADLQVLEHA